MYYPILLEVKGKKCVVIGGGEVAERKVRALLKFGAKVLVVAPQINAGITKLARQKKISLKNRRYKCCDLDKARLVIGATDNQATNQKISKDAQKSNIVVNIVDDPKLCTFIVPSIIKRGPLVVAISTSGQAPSMSKALRLSLEKIITPQLGNLTAAAGRLRRKGLDRFRRI